MDKYCRICWNTKNWRRPTGEAAKLETGKSYVAVNGFGHEEWLFNFSWLLSGKSSADSLSYRYGFLQPIGRFYDKYKGNKFSVLLYARSPEGKCLVVARINDLYVPEEEELSWALSQMKAKRWIATMRNELKSLGIDNTPLRNPRPRDIVNVRFSHDTVTFFDPRPVVDENHKICRVARYQPFNWDGNSIPTTYSPQNETIPPSNENDDDDPTRSEEARTRAAVESTSYEPRHIKLQNMLYRKLCSSYGSENVDYERAFVDLITKHNGTTTFIEVKTCLTAKRCVREAIGQLLEYSHYPELSMADELIVVGDAIATEKDEFYIRFLRDNYHLPVRYCRWNWAIDELEAPI